MNNSVLSHGTALPKQIYTRKQAAVNAGRPPQPATRSPTHLSLLQILQQHPLSAVHVVGGVAHTVALDKQIEVVGIVGPGGEV